MSGDDLVEEERQELVLMDGLMYMISEDRHSKRWTLPAVETEMRKRWFENAGDRYRDDKLAMVKKELMSSHEPLTVRYTSC